jgi:hypothetical protein
MACGDDMKTLLSRHVDGELAPEERTRVEEHVANCGPCRELLQIFQKNESILSNALSTESFGNTVIESVISEIKREAQPVEAKPVDEGATEWFRSRPLLPLAAAALFVVGLIAILSMSHSRDIDKVEARLTEQAVKVQELTQLLSKTSEDHAVALVNLRVDEATRQSPPNMMLAFISAQHLVVRANFDLKQYGSFSVWRRGEGETNDKFVKMSGDRRLESPEYIDTSVKPGQAYVYKFRAYRSAKEEDSVDSFPVTMRVPKVFELAPERSIRVQCVDIGYTRKVAKFLLHRVINGKPVTEEFAIKPGERLGEIVDVPNVGKVDFRTSLTLDKLEDGNQTLAVSYTKAVLDQNGKELIDRVNKDGTVEVKTEQVEGVLSIRPNLRAFFRTSGSSTADVDLWKGAWLLARSQD